MSDDSTSVSLPWVTGYSFWVHGYSAGHSHLLMRGKANSGDDVVNILFESVSFMSLHTHYPEVTFRRISPEEAKCGVLPNRGFLYIAIQGLTNIGLVVCGRMTARRSPSPDYFGYESDILLNISASGD